MLEFLLGLKGSSLLQGLAMCFLVSLLGATDPGDMGFRVVVGGGGVIAHKLRRTNMNLDGDTSPIEPAHLP